MVEPTKILFATRAIESPPREGGFVLLSDLAREFSGDAFIAPSVFSASKKRIPEIGTEKVFSKQGWGRGRREEFLIGLRRKSNNYDIVHTAHIPTRQNSILIKSAIRKARRNGTLFVQTITGLPKIKIENKQLSKLLWGDHIVCQSPDIYKRVTDLRESVSLITPWPPESRIRYDKNRRLKSRISLFPKAKKIVLFPGEFKRLGVETDFATCLEYFFKNSPESIVVLACRFDKDGIGEVLQQKFPGKVISLGETGEIIPLLEASDLVIYPVRKMDSKFRPPLVLLESLQLGTPVLASDIVGLDSLVSKNLHLQSTNAKWEEFGKRMVSTLLSSEYREEVKSYPFIKMAKDYHEIYRHLIS